MALERVVWGPPGTGKTTFATRLASEWIKSGVGGGEIAYLAFTKAAAMAASVKIMHEDAETDHSDAFPHFRTIHSLCYRGLRQAKPDLRLIHTGHMKEFARRSSMEGVYAVYDWEDLAEVYRRMENQGRTSWDQMLGVYMLSRITARSVGDLNVARRVPSTDACRLMRPKDMDRYESFVEKYEAFKEKEGLIDFTDMLEFGLKEMPPLDGCRKVILDEAQDLCALHHALVDRLLGHAEEIWWVGDDDQALFKFCGASAELFLGRARRATLPIALTRTHRFGPEIVDFSLKIIRRVSVRHEKSIVAAESKKGTVLLAGEFAPVFGNVFILHRHVKGCEAVADAYMTAGLPFRNERGKDPLGAPVRVKAWKTLDLLAEGKTVSGSAAAEMIEALMPSYIRDSYGQTLWLVPKGAKSRLEEVPRETVTLKRLVAGMFLTEAGMKVLEMRDYRTLHHSEYLEYYHRVSGNGYDVEAAGKIPVITTIHGAKGRQAERTVVFSEMGLRCWEDADTEHRLAYVAATRTETDVTICAERRVDWARSQYDYPVEVQGVTLGDTAPA